MAEKMPQRTGTNPPFDQSAAGVRPQPTHGTPAQERGERVETGKTVARAGHSQGKVPGATPDKPKQSDDDCGCEKSPADRVGGRNM